MFNHIHPDEYETITADAISIFDNTYNEEEIIFIIEHFNVSLSCILTTQTLSDKIINTYFLRTDNKYCKNSVWNIIPTLTYNSSKGHNH